MVKSARAVITMQHSSVPIRPRFFFSRLLLLLGLLVACQRGGRVHEVPSFPDGAPPPAEPAPVYRNDGFAEPPETGAPEAESLPAEPAAEGRSSDETPRAEPSFDESATLPAPEAAAPRVPATEPGTAGLGAAPARRDAKDSTA